MRLAHQARAAPRWPFPAEVREPRGGRQRKWPRSCSLCACAPCPVAAFGAVLCPVFISPREGGARIPSGGRALLTSAALVPLTMAGILFEDIFDVKDIDPEGKKFDRGKVCRGGMREEANMPTQVARPPSVPPSGNSCLFVFIMRNLRQLFLLYFLCLESGWPLTLVLVNPCAPF